MESSRPGRIAPLDTLRREAQRSLFRVHNGIKVLAGPDPEVGLTPNQVVWRRDKADSGATRATRRRAGLRC